MERLINGLLVYYETYGTGKPLLLIHGFTPDHRLMKGCFEPLFATFPDANERWQRIYFDLPGMGRTPGADWLNSTDDMLGVVLSFIDQVIPGKRFVLAGESYGGYLARGVLTRHFDQVDGLLLLCPVIVAPASERERPEHTVIVENQALLSTLQPDDAEEFGWGSVVHDAYNWERFRDEVLAGLQAADSPFLEKIQLHYALSFDPDALSAAYTKPVLILAGRQDSVVGYRDAWRILEHYPCATFAVLDRAGHNLQIEQPALFNALVSEWLDRVTEAAR